MDVLALDLGSFWFEWLWPILQFVIGLGLVVFVHELGHFLAAKWAGVRVEQFAFGFPPKLFGVRWGETEYRVNLIPLGGYVKMTGQEDTNPSATAPDDPRSWQRTSCGRRVVILSAGVAMNVVFSLAVFVIVYLVGIRFAAPVVGAVESEFPAATVELPSHVAEAMGKDRAVGLAPRDRILTLNGERVRRFDQIKMAAVLSDTGESFNLGMARPVDGREIAFHVDLTPKLDYDARFGEYYAFGIGPAATTVVSEPGDDVYVGESKFRKGDRIVSVGGQPVADQQDVRQAVRDHAGKPVAFVVRRDDRDVPVTVQPMRIAGRDRVGLQNDDDRQEPLTILGMSPRIVVAKPAPDGQAKSAGIEKGDIIVDYAGEGPPSMGELLAISKQRVGQPTPISVLRDGKTLDLTVTPEWTDEPPSDQELQENPPKYRAIIGIASAAEQSPVVAANIRPDSPAARAGIPEGAVITGVNDQPVKTWAELYAELRARRDQPVTLTWEQDGETASADLGVLPADDFDPDRYHFGTPAVGGFEIQKTDPVRGNPIQAVSWSVKDTKAFMVSVYKTLRNISKGRASTKGISGPVGIGAIAITKGREGVIHLAYFMAMLSVLVAVFNFLPLPVLDGGHVVLVAIEKLRGRPLPVKVVAAIQFVGLAALLCLFLLITWQDLVRIIQG